MANAVRNTLVRPIGAEYDWKRAGVRVLIALVLAAVPSAPLLRCQGALSAFASFASFAAFIAAIEAAQWLLWRRSRRQALLPVGEDRALAGETPAKRGWLPRIEGGGLMFAPRGVVSGLAFAGVFLVGGLLLISSLNVCTDVLFSGADLAGRALFSYGLLAAANVAGRPRR